HGNPIEQATPQDYTARRSANLWPGFIGPIISDFGDIMKELRNALLICLVLTSLASAQRPTPNSAQATQPAAAAQASTGPTFMREGDFTIIRPHKPVKGPKDTDESTDCYDTVEWLIKNIPGNTGKVGMWGVSQPGFFAAAGMIDAHPALVAVSPQAPVTDYYLNDDSYHNGAFMLAHRFRFYQGFRQREGEPAPPPPAQPFDFGTPDGYEFYLNMGSLWDADAKYFKHQQPFWVQNIEHTTYDEFWQARSIWKHLKGIKPAVMIVGGWYDQEDSQGPLRMFDFMEKNSPPENLMLVMGPWNHGGFARGDGDKLGNVNFGSKTGVYYREKIEFPFFMYHLKGKGDGKFPRAWLFETGTNQWRKFDTWPPQQAQSKTIYLDAKG